MITATKDTSIIISQYQPQLFKYNIKCVVADPIKGVQSVGPRFKATPAVRVADGGNRRISRRLCFFVGLPSPARMSAVTFFDAMPIERAGARCSRIMPRVHGLK